MTNRVLVDSSGLKVSMPGVNVLTAAEDDLLLSSDILTMQIVARGTVALSSGQTSANITLPDLGFRPLVIVAHLLGVWKLTYNSNTSLTVTINPNSNSQGTINDYWPNSFSGLVPNLSGNLYYFVTNIPLP